MFGYWSCATAFSDSVKSLKGSEQIYTAGQNPSTPFLPLAPLLASCSVLIGCHLTQSAAFYSGQLALRSSQNVTHLWVQSPQMALEPIDPNQSILKRGFHRPLCITCTIHPHQLNARGTVTIIAFLLISLFLSFLLVAILGH